MTRNARATRTRTSGLLLLAGLTAVGLAACSSSGGGAATSPTLVPSSTAATTPAVVASTSPAGTGIPGLPVDFVHVEASDASATTVQPQPAAGACHAQGSGPFVLPDPVCNPGAVSTAVTTANLTSTVCTAGWGATVPKPVTTVLYTEIRESKAAYGYPAHGGSYSYGYVVPLQLGGAGNDPRNAWPVTNIVNTQRNRLAARLETHVCDGSLSLAAAQYLMARDFVNAYTDFVGPVAEATAPKSGATVVLGTACSPSGAIENDTAGGLAACKASNGSLVWTTTG